MTHPTWLVTGGAGFIGSNFVHWLLSHDANAHVVVLDKLTYAGSLANLEALPDPERMTFVRGDIASRDDVRAVLSAHRPIRILNFAAESHVDRSIDSPRDFIQTNVTGTFELLEGARGLFSSLSAEERSDFRFLHVSTDEVYGSLGDAGLFDESSPYAPNSPYAASKAGADMIVTAYHRTYGLPTLITNCSNNYGPRQFPEKLIPLMLLNAIEGERLPVYGDGANVRDWLFVEDHCTGLARAIEAGEPGETYALGGRCERKNIEIVESLCAGLEAIRPAAQNEALRAKGVGAYSELVDFVTDRPGHDRRYAIDPGRAEKELDWRPAHSLDSALAHTIRWYLENDEWRKTIEREGSERQRRGLSSLDSASGSKRRGTPE